MLIFWTTMWQKLHKKGSWAHTPTPRKSLYKWLTPSATKVVDFVRFCNSGYCLPSVTDLADLVDQDVKYFRFLHCNAYYRVPQPPGQWLCQFGCSFSSQGLLSSPWFSVRPIWWSALSWCPDGQASCHTPVSILLLFQSCPYLFLIYFEIIRKFIKSAKP